MFLRVRGVCWISWGCRDCWKVWGVWRKGGSKGWKVGGKLGGCRRNICLGLGMRRMIGVERGG